MDSQRRRRPIPPLHHYSFHYLLVVPIILAIATGFALFVHSDVNVAMLYSQCHSRSRLPALSHLPVIGAPSCFIVSFFEAAAASARTFATLAAILSFIGGLLTVSTVEAARICNAPNVLIAYPTGAWLVFNLMGGAIVWQLVILPAFFHRARKILRDRKEGGAEALRESEDAHPTFGQNLRHLTVDAEIVAIPASVALGFVVPSVLMLVYDSPPFIGVWLFFPVWVSIIRQLVRAALLRYQTHERKSLHLESHRRYLMVVYAVPVLCSALAHGLLIYSAFTRDDRKEMTRSTIKFIEIDVFFIALTVLYWLFIEAGWRVALVMMAVSVVLGPGAGVCIGWIYRETAIYHGLADDEEEEEPANERTADEETPLLT
jgi:hypothetical protein